jgi:nicotinate-nucleotide--dimethylbenzimidazole phosphoribosyltransferase
MDVGSSVVDGLTGASSGVGHSILAIGEMGIGNTSSASAMVAALTGRPVEQVTGYGAGLDEAGRRRKIVVIERGLDVNRPRVDRPLDVMAAVGGFEIAALVGVILRAAERRIPVILDGFITGAAALVGARLVPGIEQRLLAAHRSPEPGHAVVLECLGLKPMLELDLRLGEASGAALGLLLIDAAIRVRDGMATFDSAGVSGRT